MPFRVRRSIRIAKGVRLNLSKSGASVSSKIGPVTLNSRGTGSVHVAPGVSYRFGSQRTRGTSTAHPQTWAARSWAKPKSARHTFWWAVFGGWLGLQRFYLRQPLVGLLYALTVGLAGIGWVVDAVRAKQITAKANARLGFGTTGVDNP